MDSILNSVKKVLGISEENTDFDIDIIMHINTVFLTLNQLGVGPEDGFTISDDTTQWSEFIGDNKKLECVKSYVSLKVRLLFDPPSGSLLDAITKSTNELEFRILCVTDTANN